MQTSLLGSYSVYAGLAVLIAGHFGINLIQSDVEATIGVIVIVFGAIYSHFAHKAAVETIKGLR